MLPWPPSDDPHHIATGHHDAVNQSHQTSHEDDRRERPRGGREWALPSDLDERRSRTGPWAVARATDSVQAGAVPRVVLHLYCLAPAVAVARALGDGPFDAGERHLHLVGGDEPGRLG